MEALKTVRDVVLPVPVFIGLGDRDILRESEKVPAAFPASPAVVLESLPDTGCSHFLFASRTGLFDGLADWAMVWR